MAEGKANQTPHKLLGLKDTQGRARVASRLVVMGLSHPL